MEGWQRTFVLHSHPQNEASLVLDIFTKESGRVRLIARNTRSKRSTLREALQPFTPLLLRFGRHGEVKTLHSAEAVSLALPLNGIMPYNDLYISELLSRVPEYETRFSELFFDYLRYIQSFAGITDTSGPALRRFELALLGHLGCGVNFTHCADNDEPADDTMICRYREEKGFIASIIVDSKTFTERQLKALNARKFPDTDTPRAAKRFTHMTLKPYLGDKPLKSRELFRQFISERMVKTHYEW